MPAPKESTTQEISVNLSTSTEQRYLSNPGYFLIKLGHTDEGPRVVMPDGRIIEKDYKHPMQFSDASAEAYAEQNDGIYFPANCHSDKFMLGDYLAAVKRLLVNDEKAAELAKQDRAFTQVENDCKYLEGKVGLTMGAHPDALEQAMAIGVYGEADLEKLQEQNRNYRVFLVIGLSGFGSDHFSVSFRNIAAKIDLRGLEKGDLAERIISQYICSNNESREERGSTFNYKYDWENDKLNLRLETPVPHGSSNPKLEKQVHSFMDIKGLFFQVADKVQKAIDNRKEHEQQQKKKVYSETASMLGLEDVLTK